MFQTNADQHDILANDMDKIDLSGSSSRLLRLEMVNLLLLRKLLREGSLPLL
jgi:hypothetical protein